MRIDTTRFGAMDVAEESIVQMPEGMLGFAEAKRFVLLQDDQTAAFSWLQAVDDPNLAFIVVNTRQFFPDYRFVFPEEQTASLGLKSPREAAILTTVTIGNDGAITTNMLGPIVMNPRTLLARQIVLEDSRYGPKHSIRELPGTDAARPEWARAA